jgi:hypothetical protein
VALAGGPLGPASVEAPGGGTLRLATVSGGGTST